MIVVRLLFSHFCVSFKWKSEFRQNYRTNSRPQFQLSLLGSLASFGRAGTWRRKWERLRAGESSGTQPPRICPGCSVPEPHQSHDWALVPASPASKAEY